MGLFDNFPYTNFHELNLDWILKALKQIEDVMNQFVSLNTIKYADPLEWNITTQYPKNTVVIDPQTGVAYISTDNVPAGADISNTDYWTKVFDLSPFIAGASSNFAINYEANITYHATMITPAGRWLVWNNKLYIATEDIYVGDTYIVDGNIERKTVEEFFNQLKAALQAEITARSDADTALGGRIDQEILDRQAADTALGGRIDQEILDRQAADSNITNNIIGNLNNLPTVNKSNIVNAINEIFTDLNKVNGEWITPEDFGAVGDGVTDDTQAVQSAISDGRPVRFINNYAVTTIHFTYGLSTRLLDGGDNYIISLDATKTPVEFCGGGALIYRLGIRQHNQINEPPALYWYSENGGASNFNIFYDLRFDYCYHCIKYGDGSEIAQSENRIIGMFTYSCSRMVTLHGRLLQLWIDEAVLNASQFPSQGTMASMIEVTRGSILFIDNSTIENVGFEQQSGIVSTGECYINNCVLEIAGINLACFREANGVDNDGLISLTNSRAYQGGVAKDFVDIALNGTLIMQNCYILKLSPSTLFFYHNTTGCRIVLDNVKGVNVTLPTGMFPNMELHIDSSTFDNLKMLNRGYFHLDNVCVPSPSAEAEIWDNTVYGNFEAYIADIRSSVYVGTTNAYLLLAGGAVGNSKGAFIYTSPNHKFGILRNYMTEYGSSIVGGVCFT